MMGRSRMKSRGVEMSCIRTTLKVCITLRYVLPQRYVFEEHFYEQEGRNDN